MTCSRPASLRSRLSWSRITTAALLALQVVVAFSPIAERLTPISRVVHTHDQQEHHARLHDDATCAICAARTSMAEAAGPTEDVERIELPRETPGTARPVIVPRPARATNSSRAPPVLS